MSKASGFDWRLMLAALITIPVTIMIGYVPINGVDLADLARKFRHEARVKMMQEHVTSWDGLYTKNSTDTLIGFYSSIDSYANYERSSEKPQEPLELKLSTELSDSAGKISTSTTNPKE